MKKENKQKNPQKMSKIKLKQMIKIAQTKKNQVKMQIKNKPNSQTIKAGKHHSQVKNKKMLHN